MTTQVTWQDIVALTVVSSPAIIAAISSLRNGRKLDERLGPSRVSKPNKNGTKARDWYNDPRPPSPD